MNIGVIGFGVVGEAVGLGFLEHGHSVYANDPRWKVSHWKDVELVSKQRIAETCDVAFICVETPTGEKGIDLSHVYEAFNQLHLMISQHREDKEALTIVIKSTVIPGTTDTLTAMYPCVAVNPEFLRQETALEDFLHPDRIVVGTENHLAKKALMKLYEDFDCPIYYVKPAEAELVKYMANTFFLVKVAFAQEISRICTLLKLDAMKVYEALTMDHRIESHHLDPSLGRVSLFTPCLSKDMLALIRQLDASGYDTCFLKTAFAKAVDGVKLKTKLEIET